MALYNVCLLSELSEVVIMLPPLECSFTHISGFDLLSGGELSGLFSKPGFYGDLNHQLKLKIDVQRTKAKRTRPEIVISHRKLEYPRSNRNSEHYKETYQ